MYPEWQPTTRQLIELDAVFRDEARLVQRLRSNAAAKAAKPAAAKPGGSGVASDAGEAGEEACSDGGGGSGSAPLAATERAEEMPPMGHAASMHA
eukprot:352497-Chlamydomonas_euryale.AAC.4